MVMREVSLFIADVRSAAVKEGGRSSARGSAVAAVSTS
jgi:hypothetical protein